MSHSLAKILVHIVFSTKNRRPLITKPISKELYSYTVSIAKEYGSQVYEIGGIENHIHMMATLPRTITVSKLLEEIKKSSSKWIKTKGNEFYDFAWQSGYGAFSIGQSGSENLRKYIQNQEEHHKKISFEDEYRELLKKYNVQYNENYLWD